jgi:hypothetical protein
MRRKANSTGNNFPLGVGALSEASPMAVTKSALPVDNPPSEMVQREPVVEIARLGVRGIGLAVVVECRMAREY